MSGPTNGSVTALLSATAEGDDRARSELWSAIYDELRDLASALMARERSDHTLQPTALVNEAYVRLLGGERVRKMNRPYFFRAAAEAMRRILIEHARKGSSRKKARGVAAQSFIEQLTLPAMDPSVERVELLNSALDELAVHDRGVYDVVMLRFFGGISIDDTAEAVGTSPRTVKRYWTYGRTWLYRRITGANDGSGDGDG